MTATGRSSETATVEVLTAEVRVLQVGRRQITLSVYRQLDRVKPTQIEPFGRVHDSQDEEASSWHLFVIGRGRADGALVRSDFRDPSHRAWPSPEVREEAEQLWREWDELPLVVLAGLR